MARERTPPQEYRGWSKWSSGYGFIAYEQGDYLATVYKHAGDWYIKLDSIDPDTENETVHLDRRLSNPGKRQAVIAGLDKCDLYLIKKDLPSDV